MYLPAVQPFKLELRWLQAQAFRWSEPKKDGWYYGVVRDSLIKVRQSGDGIEFHADVSEESLAPSVINYFRLDQDITPIQDALRGLDATMARLVNEYDGMRILRQDPWECLAAYICSQTNRVERITQIVDRLANCYGVEHTLDGVPRNAFPTPQRLVEIGAAELESLGFGLNRGRRIYTVATDITEGYLDLGALSRMRHQQARAVLMSYNGIGAKIADCVSLFSLNKPEAFPVDRHIGEALKQYGERYTAGTSNAGLMQWAHNEFGSNAGYAGQLLFLDQLRKA